MSSPVTTPTFTFPRRVSFLAEAITASAHERGFTPPAFAVTRIPFATSSGSSRSISATKSVA